MLNLSLSAHDPADLSGADRAVAKRLPRFSGEMPSGSIENTPLSVTERKFLWVRSAPEPSLAPTYVLAVVSIQNELLGCAPGLT